LRWDLGRGKTSFRIKRERERETVDEGLAPAV